MRWKVQLPEDGSDALDSEHNPEIGLIVETQRNYFASVTFPDRIEVGLRIAPTGEFSLRDELAIFRDRTGRTSRV